MTTATTLAARETVTCTACGTLVPQHAAHVIGDGAYCAECARIERQDRRAARLRARG